MEGKRSKQIPLACRFLPYDQWFLTHVDPTWKIKHIKQIVLAKCLSIPFDPRKLAREATGADAVRPPSPITFAPDESQRPVSPIQFASPREARRKRSAGVPFGLGAGGRGEDGDSEGGGGGSGSAEGGFVRGGDGDDEALGGEEGYEEDDEWDDDDDSGFVVGGGLVAAPSGGKRSSVVMGGRVQVPGVAVGSPPVAAGPTSPMKIRKKFNPLAKIASSSFTATSSSAAPSDLPSSTALVLQQQQNQIHTGCYTLIRFSTGQILEEDIPVAWYDLLPNELVELHASIPPLSFAMSVKLAWNLMNPAGMLQLLAERDQEFRARLKAKGRAKPKSHHTHNNNNDDGTESGALPGPISASLTLVSLPRHDPKAYAQPYWEGWVRALRMVYVGGDATTAAAAAAGGGGGRDNAKMNMQEYAMGMTNISGNMAGGMGLVAPLTGAASHGGAADVGKELVPAAGGEGGGSGQPTSEMKRHLEWRERYVVIKDGVVNLFKTRDDLTPTHRLPLSNLMALRDVADMASVLNTKTSRSSASTNSGAPSTVVARPSHPSTSHSRRPRSSRGASATPAEGSTKDREKEAERRRKRRSTSLPRSSTSTAKDYRRGGPADAGGGSAGSATHRVTSSSSKSGAGTEVSRRGRSHDRDHLRPSTSRPAQTPMTEAEREARKRAAAEQWQKEREARERRRKEREAHEKEVEYLKRWDDIGLSIWPKKDKGKGKEKEVSNGKERERDRAGEASSKGKERETDHDQDRRERDRQRQHGKAKRDERTFIPSTNEEAEAAGMKIVCAKFRQLRPWEKDALDRAAAKGHKYTSTGPSLAGDAAVNVTSEAESYDAERVKHNKNVFSEDVNNPPRRPSLPVLVGLLANSPSVPSSLNLTASSPATSSAAVHSIHSVTSGSVGAASSAVTSPSVGPPKFIGGLFGKDKAPDAEERKREEKERKAREKELKALEKEKKKAKRREEKDTGDEEDAGGGGTGSGLGWKLRWNPSSSAAGKMRERESIDTATLSPPPAISAAPSSSTLLSGRQTDEEQPKEEVAPSYRPTEPLNAHQQDEARRTASLPNLRDDSCPPPSSTNRPKLSLSPIASTSELQPTKEIDDADQHSEGHQSVSGSSSRSLSSPVFAHSTDEDESGDDFDDEFGFGTSGYRRDRMGYRYGGYQRKLDKEKNKGAAAGPPTASDAARGAQQRTAAAGDVAEVGGEGDTATSRDVSQTRSTQSQPQRRDKRRRREEERGEWIVLDMGNEHAYSSMLRVLHRYFSQPLSSTFVKSSITGVPTPSAVNPNVTSPESPKAASAPNVNSPTQAHFWSSATLVADAKSTISDRTKSLRTADSFSSMYVPLPPPSTRQTGRPSTAGSDADDEDPQANPAPPAQAEDQALIPPSVLQTQTKTEHPPILNTSVKAKKTVNITPALRYPEWRHEVVERARQYGMREAGRPLDLALHGWSKEFDERGVFERLEARQKKMKDKMEGRKARQASAQAEQAGDEDEDEDEYADAEEGSDDAPAGFDDEQRRMSAISHVSTLNAYQMNAAAAAAIANRPSASSSDQTFLLDEDHDQPPPASATADRDDDVESAERDDFQPEYSFKYGHEDEEEAIALGMDSFMEESEEESETEWVAWVTDLPRQVQVRAEKRKLAQERERERRRMEAEKQLLVAKEDEHANPQLSPMVFSDPFAQEQQQSQLPRSNNGSQTNLVINVERSLSESRAGVAGSSRSGHSLHWKGQEEERRQVLESRRMMEPTATSTFLPLPPLPPPVDPLAAGYGQRPASSSALLHPSAHQHPLIHRAPFSRTPAQVLIQSETRVGAQVPVPIHHLHRKPSRTLSSVESLSNTGRGGATPNVPPISISVPLVGPRSPQLGSFSPESDLTDNSRDAPSSSTTPPSASGHYQPSRLGPKTHSRTPSGADGSMSRLYHSSSMPLAAAAAVTARPSSLGVSSGGSVPSSPPRSPMRSVSATTSATPHPHPVDMPILTQEQIHQIEVETEMMMQNSGRTSSSPPSSYTPHIPMPMPRRSSSAGMTMPVGFSSGSPPPKSTSGSPSESRLGMMNAASGGSVGRSASVLVKPHPPEGASEKSGRGVLRKRLSDIGKQMSGDEKDSPPSAKSRKPKLSLAGLGGGGSSSQSDQQQPEMHSPTYQYQRQGLRSPTISNPSSSSAHTHSGAGGIIGSGSGSGNSGTMASAKALLRRVRSGSSLRMDMHAEERESPIASSYPVPNSPTMTSYAAAGGSNVVVADNASRGGSWGRETSPEQARKRKGPVDRLVRGLDSALEFR